MEIRRNNINKKKLEIFLQNINKPETYSIDLEQYPTDANSASILLLYAYFDGNIYGKNVIDLGTGNGILALGSKYLGAEKVTGIDIDKNMVNIAINNAESNNMDINFYNMDVSQVSGHYDTVIMNPPFGSIIKHDDIVFIDKALEISDNIYSIHNMKSHDFIIDYYSKRGKIRREQEISIVTPRIYKHHKKDLYEIKSFLLYVTKDWG